jgi:hypothetical protein
MMHMANGIGVMWVLLFVLLCWNLEMRYRAICLFLGFLFAAIEFAFWKNGMCLCTVQPSVQSTPTIISLLFAPATCRLS